MSTIQIDRLLETVVKRKASDLAPRRRQAAHAANARARMRELQTKVLEP